jgi:hypothetical protein
MTKRTDHDQIGDLLDRYRTGELDERDRLMVERHLETCEPCRGELEALAAFAARVERGYVAERAARAAEREPDWGRLRAAVVERTHGRAPRRARLARYVPQAALAVLALVAVGVLWEQGVRDPREADRALRSERPAERRADRGGERSGGPLSSPGTPPAETPADQDRFAAAERVDVEMEARTNAVPPTVSRDRVVDAREWGLDETGLRGRAGRVERDADLGAADQAAGGRVAKEAPSADALEEAAPPSEPAEDRVQAKTRPEAARQEAEAQVQAREGHGEAAAAAPPELERFRTAARSALLEADTLLAARALAQWRDSLAPRRDLPPELERAARALADSLSAFLANRP